MKQALDLPRSSQCESWHQSITTRFLPVRLAVPGQSHLMRDLSPERASFLPTNRNAVAGDRDVWRAADGRKHGQERYFNPTALKTLPHPLEGRWQQAVSVPASRVRLPMGQVCQRLTKSYTAAPLGAVFLLCPSYEGLCCPLTT